VILVVVLWLCAFTFRPTQQIDGAIDVAEIFGGDVIRCECSFDRNRVRSFILLPDLVG
jgi:hypothetical protein